MYNVLLVDDKEAYRRGIQRMPFFRNTGSDFQILQTARNGKEALECLHENHIDLVLTDIRIPIMDGLSLLKEIHQNTLCGCTVLLSEYRDFTYAREGIVYGAFDYLVQPIKEEQLRDVLERASVLLQRQSDQVSLDDVFIDKLSSRLLQEQDGSDLETMLGLVKNKLLEQGDPSRMALYARHILSGLPGRLLHTCSWLDLYLPLEEICNIPLDTASADGLYDSFAERIHFLNRLLNQYRFTGTDQITEVRKYIVENIGAITGVQQLADYFCLNKNYLSTLFARETGTRCTDFINSYRIERAKRLLSYTDLKLQAIAEVVGFRDVEYFTRVFKRYTGMPPREYHWHKVLAQAGLKT